MQQKVSLISTILNDSDLLPEALKNLESFTQKLPLQWQWIIARSRGKFDQDIQIQSEKIEIAVLDLPRQYGRAESLQAALQKAEGDYVAIFPVDFTIPLSELFAFLQEMVLNHQADIAIGNRWTGRKLAQFNKTSWHLTLEKILKEKYLHLPESDPLCGYMIFKKASLAKILPLIKLKSWYYSLDILKAAHSENLKVIQVPILSKDKKNSRIPLFKEYLRHLF